MDSTQSSHLAAAIFRYIYKATRGRLFWLFFVVAADFCLKRARAHHMKPTKQLSGNYRGVRLPINPQLAVLHPQMDYTVHV